MWSAKDEYDGCSSSSGHKYFSIVNIFLLLPGISCVQFDDTRIVSGSSDKTIKVRIAALNFHIHYEYEGW